MLRRALAALMMAALTACATVPPNPLTADQRQALFVREVTLQWALDDAARADNPAYQEGKTDLERRLQEAVVAAFRDSPAGGEAVRFQVSVLRYDRVGALMGNMIGGQNIVAADVHVVRVSDGQIIATYPAVTGVYASNAGIIGAVAQAVSRPDVVGIMSNNFAQTLRRRFDSAR